MPDKKTYENYPFWIPLLSVLLSLAIYVIGICILSGFGLIYVLLYILFCVWLEYHVMSKSCRNCYYYGKLCGLGKGKLASLFIKKGDTKNFTEREIGWKDLIPDLLVFLIPFIAGIIYLFIHFNVLTLALVVAIIILAMPITGFMRSCLPCPNCKQRELGCSAQKLFGKNKNP